MRNGVFATPFVSDVKRMNERESLQSKEVMVGTLEWQLGRLDKSQTWSDSLTDNQSPTWSTNLIVISDNDDDDIVDDAFVPTQSVQSVTWCNNFFVARFFQIQGLAILHTHTHRQK